MDEGERSPVGRGSWAFYQLRGAGETFVLGRRFTIWALRLSKQSGFCRMELQIDHPIPDRPRG